MHLSTSLVTAQVSDGFGPGAGWGHRGGWGWGMAISGWVFMALLIVLVVWMIWSTTQRQAPGTDDENRVRRILDERYARGEIERDEYLERKADLEL